eukprot:4167063-Pleurochrysis_carterae.AAC.2
MEQASELMVSLQEVARRQEASVRAAEGAEEEEDFPRRLVLERMEVALAVTPAAGVMMVVVVHAVKEGMAARSAAAAST